MRHRLEQPGRRTDGGTDPRADTTTVNSAISAGNPWIQRIEPLAVSAPKTPATTTQARKKTLSANPSVPRKRLQTRPADKNPLYSP